jgi:cell division septation protein DedD
LGEEDNGTGALMASSNRRGRDWVLGGRHLAGVFVLLVVLFGMVFTLGYLLGRHQYDAQLQAAASIVPGRPDIIPDRMPDRNNDKPGKANRGATGSSPDKAEKPAAPPLDWDFYRSADPAKPAEPLPESPKSIVPGRPLASAPTKPASRIDSPRSNLKAVSPPAIPKGAVVLQVAAMTRRSDAVALAQALQQKKFPAFVLPPGASHFYRVQVGPYADPQSADLARQKLESQGFKAITRR